MTSRTRITLGTAGHIDHGKTALVRSLTGCETDRLKEEKARGMSIDLGFAPCTIRDTQVGIVDVPGHENFVKTMVAGASGMDAVILVVAADDGVMPQTREHLDILALLGLRHGLVALTKIDRVADDMRELAQAELADFLRGTFLEGAPILPLSNLTYEGFDMLFEALDALLKTVQPKPINGIFRLPVERTFSVRGYGTVVAGIPVAGTACEGQEVVLLPQGIEGRIRRIEVYCQPSDTVAAGQCAAVNVGHWDHHAIHRGDTLTVPGCFTTGEWFVATLRLLPRLKLMLKNGAAVRFHTGTSETTAVVYSIEGNRMEAGMECLVQLHTNTPVVAGPGDRFILRALSPVHTLGGGMIVESVDRRMKRNRPALITDLQERTAAVQDERQFVEYCLRRAPLGTANVASLTRRTKIPADRVQTMLAELTVAKRGVSLGSGLYMHRETCLEMARQILDSVAEFHRQSPESPGIPPEQLGQTCPVPRAILDPLVTMLKQQGRLVEHNQRLAVSEHRVSLSAEQANRLAAIEALFHESLFQPPGAEEVAIKMKLPPATVQQELKILCEHGRLVLVENLLFHKEAVDQARAILVEHLRKEGRLESVDFKYLLDTTRKYALVLLDYFDRIGVTRRVGNTRHLGTAERAPR